MCGRCEQGYSKACVGKVNYNLTDQRDRCEQGYTIAIVTKLSSGLDVGKARALGLISGLRCGQD